MELNRRDLLKGAVVTAGGLALPFPVTPLTDTDRAILKEVQPTLVDSEVSPWYYKRELASIKVDRRIYDRMSLRSIAGIEIEVLDQHLPALAPNYITYYYASYNEDKSKHGPARACFYPADRIDKWVKERLGA